MSHRKNNGKPVGPRTAYNLFSKFCMAEHKVRYPEIHYPFSFWQAQLGARWKTAPDDFKEKFQRKAREDRLRYATEMKDFVPPPPRPKSQPKKVPRDPNLPKLPLKVFFLFCKEERAKIKALHPAYTHADVLKECARLWKSLDPELKRKYESVVEADRRRYEREMQEHQSRSKAQADQVASNTTFVGGIVWVVEPHP